jgi:hypothetical protein
MFATVPLQLALPDFLVREDGSNMHLRPLDEDETGDHVDVFDPHDC